MANANERQVGGTHYKGGTIQHWDFIIVTGCDYLQGYSTKYMVRWRKMPKEKGLQDLEKCKHIVEKMLELASNEGPIVAGDCSLASYKNKVAASPSSVKDFLVANDVAAIIDRSIIGSIIMWKSSYELQQTVYAIEALSEAHK